MKAEFKDVNFQDLYSGDIIITNEHESMFSDRKLCTYAMITSTDFTWLHKHKYITYYDGYKHHNVYEHKSIGKKFKKLEVK